MRQCRGIAEDEVRLILVNRVGGYVIGHLTNNVTDDGFKLEGVPALVLFALIVAYFVILGRFLGGTLWQRLLGTR